MCGRARDSCSRSGSYYGYLGDDGDGYHHHVDEVTNTIYVTQGRAERFLPTGAGLYWFCVRGPIDAMLDLSKKRVAIRKKTERKNGLEYTERRLILPTDAAIPGERSDVSQKPQTPETPDVLG